MSFRQELVRFGATLAAEDEAASDLWTWLPSHGVAEKHHGDYAGEYRPSNGDVMKEAALYLAHLRAPEEPLGPEERDWFTNCPCDEEHAKEDPNGASP